MFQKYFRFPRPCSLACFLFFLIQEFNQSRGAEVELIGPHKKDSRTVTFVCRFWLNAGEKIQELRWSRKRIDKDTYTVFATYDRYGGPHVTHEGLLYLGSRAKLDAVGQTFRLTIIDLGCIDIGSYKCTLHIRLAKMANAFEVDKSVDFSEVEVEAQPPKLLYVVPNHKIYYPYDKVTLTCVAMVGRPPGSIGWYYVNNTDEYDISKHGRLLSVVTETPMPYLCGFIATSKLTIFLKRNDNGARVRCKVLGSRISYTPGCSEYCRETEPFDIRYKSFAAAAIGEKTSNKAAVVAVICIVAGVVGTLGFVGVYVYRQIKNSEGSTSPYGGFEKEPKKEKKPKEPSKPIQPLKFIQKLKFPTPTPPADPSSSTAKLEEPKKKPPKTQFMQKLKRPKKATREGTFEDPEEDLGRCWQGQI